MLRRSATGGLLLLLVLAGLLPSPPALSQVQVGATMTVIRGQVAVIRPDGSAIQPAPSGTIVRAGDEIRTLSETGALINFFVGTEIEMGEDTILVVERVSRQGERVDVSLKQVFGATLHRVQTFTDPNSAYRIEAGGAVAVVRGTTFSLLGPIATANGNVVVLVCLEDCDRLTTFAGVPLAPFTGYFVEVDRGRVVGPVGTFRVDPLLWYWQNLWEGVTIFEQLEQGETRGVPAGQVPAGQQHEVRERLEREEREEDGQPSLQGFIATATPTPIGTLTPTATPTGTPPETPALPASPTGTPTATATGTPTAAATGTPTTTPTSTPPALSIGDASVTEGSSGTTSAVFTATVSGASNETVTVGFATANDTATGGTCGTTGVDYQSTSGTLGIPPGTTSRTITVPVCGDALDEPDEETFVVNLSGPTNATIADGQGTGAVADDDRRPTTTEVTCDFDPELEARRCTATVIDTGPAPPITPTGTVSFRSSTESTTFDPNPCTLAGSDATASCSAIVGMTDFEDQTVTGAYSGDAAHAPSSGSDEIVFRLFRKIR